MGKKKKTILETKNGIASKAAKLSKREHTGYMPRARQYFLPALYYSSWCFLSIVACGSEFSAFP